MLQVIWRLSRSGGAQTVARGFLTHFDRGQFDVHVCTVRPLFEEDQVEELGDGIEYHPLSLTGPATALLRTRAVAGVARVARDVRADVLHVHGGTAWYSLLGSLVPPRRGCFIEVHDAPQSNRMSRGNQLVERFMARHVGFGAMAHSTAVRDGLVASWGLSPGAIDLVPLGIDVDALSRPRGDRAAVRASLGVDEAAPLVIFVARLVPEKRPELFVQVAARVAARHPDVSFALIGQGSSLESVRSEAVRLGIGDRMRIPGFVDDLGALYQASDIFLSTSRYEGFGLAIAEAMAAGVPVVSTDVGGVADVVGEAGILEPSDDPDHLAEHVLALLGDATRRRTLGSAAAQRARCALDVRTTTRGFERVYERIGGVSR